MSAWRIALVAALVVVGVVLSATLLLEHHGESAAAKLLEPLCGPQNDCGAVNRSAYAELGGVPLALAGLFFYASLGLLFGLSLFAPASCRPGAYFSAAVLLLVSLLVDCVLLGVQAFAIHAFCRLCLLTYLVNLGALATLWPVRRAWPALRELRHGAAGGLLVAGWAAGSVAMAAGLWSTELLLDQRAAARPLSPTVTPVEKLDLAEARHEVERLRGILADPDKLESYFAEVALKEFAEAPRQVLSLSDAPAKGPSSAPVRVVEYSDFLCPYCRSLAEALGSFLPQSGGLVSLNFKNFPLDRSCNSRVASTVHEGACWLALGAICSSEQGRFWEYHDRVFTSGLSKATQVDAEQLGREVGLEAGAFRQCLTSDRARRRLEGQIDEAARVGVTATPTLFLNGKRLTRLTYFLPVLNSELARMGLALPQPKRTP